MRIDVFQPCNAATSGGSVSPTSSSQTATPGFTNPNGPAMAILLTNAGTDILMVEFGTSAITASATTSCTILPNDKQIFSWNSGDSFAYRGITGSGSTLYWKLGYGS